MARTAPLPRRDVERRSDPRSGSDSTAQRADDVAAAFFSTWVVVGLFLDGWAHNAGKPETFWTPWHALLYSGFLAGMAWFGGRDLLSARRGTYAAPSDRLVLAGFGLFAVGGLADMVWHSIFGVEADVEALLSPSHLLLMLAGLLLVTAPVRSALTLAPPGPDTWRRFGPAAIGLTLAVAVVAFFTQFASALHVGDDDLFAAGRSDELQIIGVVSVLLVNALLLGALVWTTGRWSDPPAGTFTLVFGGTAVLMAGLDGFGHMALVVPVAAGGALADILITRGHRIEVVAVAVPTIMWSAWFAVYDAIWGLGWPPELPTGTIVLAGLSGYGLTLLAAARPGERR